MMKKKFLRREKKIIKEIKGDCFCCWTTITTFRTRIGWRKWISWRLRCHWRRRSGTFPCWATVQFPVVRRWSWPDPERPDCATSDVGWRHSDPPYLCRLALWRHWAPDWTGHWLMPTEGRAWRTGPGDQNAGSWSSMAALGNYTNRRRVCAGRRCPTNDIPAIFACTDLQY